MVDTGRLLFDEDSETWVSEKFQQLAEVINDWDPRLRLLWIPERNRGPGDIYPYAVGFFDNEFSEPHIILYLLEEELNSGVLGTLFNMRDNAQNVLEKLENMEQAKKIMEAKAQMEHQAELHDKARALWKTPLHTYTMDGKVFHL